MSNEISYLALRLEGPFQSWGFNSQFNRRNTGLMPTKSGIAGMICAAMGFPRGSELEKDFLLQFREVSFTAVSIPRKVSYNDKNAYQKWNKVLDVRRMQDFHTVKDTLKADGKIKDTHITYRQYLNDAFFGVIIKGDGILIEKIAAALKNPVWGICLGRKNCIPSAPVYAGLYRTEKDGLEKLLQGRPIEEFTRQVEAVSFEEGKDTLSDQAVSFNSSARKFIPRRVLTIEAGEQ
jgi:CRISPR system Cascade subunit CasD